jgi:hypothetical protein
MQPGRARGPILVYHYSLHNTQLVYSLAIPFLEPTKFVKRRIPSSSLLAQIMGWVFSFVIGNASLNEYSK